MNIKCDYHIHTPLCNHAEGNPIEYLQEASRKKLKVIGFSDHSPVPVGFDTTGRMKFDEFDEYKNLIKEIEINEFDIEVLFGLEMDWVADRSDEIYDFIDKENFDYIIGSIHHVDSLPMDHPDHMDVWNNNTVDYVWNSYIDSVYNIVTSDFKFDIIGHFDLPKKFGFFPVDKKNFFNKISEVFTVIAEKNICIEISTAGLRKKVKEIYPSLEILKHAKNHNVKITFGSDSHSPGEVGYSFDTAEKLALEAGYNTYYVIHKGNIKEEIPLI
ncbi:MAG TPA: histidinol-phosphatase [Victivallales bacterium]|nr:histidinol-phosphatase [Victivallales bacterium]